MIRGLPVALAVVLFAARAVMAEQGAIHNQNQESSDEDSHPSRVSPRDDAKKETAPPHDRAGSPSVRSSPADDDDADTSLDESDRENRDDDDADSGGASRGSDDDDHDDLDSADDADEGLGDDAD